MDIDEKFYNMEMTIHELYYLPTVYFDLPVTLLERMGDILKDNKECKEFFRVDLKQLSESCVTEFSDRCEELRNGEEWLYSSVFSNLDDNEQSEAVSQWLYDYDICEFIALLKTPERDYYGKGHRYTLNFSNPQCKLVHGTMEEICEQAEVWKKELNKTAKKSYKNMKKTEKEKQKND